MLHNDIPHEQRERNPLIAPEGYERLRAILDHPAAPRWNYQVGDRVVEQDLSDVESMARMLRTRRPGGGTVPDTIACWVERMRPQVPLFMRMIPEGFDIARDWQHIPTMTRADIAERIEQIVPLDADRSRLITYETSGVTGHAIYVPHHPATMAQNHPLLEYVLEQYGISLSFGPDTVACLNVGAQASTVMFATVFSVWNQAGFAKVNLHKRMWNRADASRFFSDMAPLFLTGDPVGFAQMAAWQIPCRPAAMVSTAVALSPQLQKRLESIYECPVIDTYATTETGVIAYAAPGGKEMAILPPDIYVESVNEDGFPVSEGELGEVCVSGGRNPYLPLLRYRTGDHARMQWSAPESRDGAPLLYDLRARENVSFVGCDGSVISMVDVGRIIREWPIVQHEFAQYADSTCSLVMQPVSDSPPDIGIIQRKLRELFGEGIPIRIELDENLSESRPGGKGVPFRSEIAHEG